MLTGAKFQVKTLSRFWDIKKSSPGGCTPPKKKSCEGLMASKETFKLIVLDKNKSTLCLNTNSGKVYMTIFLAYS